MEAFFFGLPYPPEHLLSQNVHILMDRGSGKTFNSAFIELALTPHQAGLVIQSRNLKMLKGRVVTVEVSNQDELMRSVFPKWVGNFVLGEPVLFGEDKVLEDGVLSTTTALDKQESLDDTEAVHGQAQAQGATCATALSESQTSAAPTGMCTPTFVTREEINALLVVCRNYKVTLTLRRY